MVGRLLKPFRGSRLATSVVESSVTAGALATQQLMLEVAGDLDAGRVAVVIANFASSPGEITLNISKLGVVPKTSQSSVLDLLSLRNESMPCARTMNHKCVELQVALPAASIRVIELTTKKTPVQQRCRFQLEEYFAPNVTFIGLANYTPSCSQEPPLCREHLPPPCVDQNTEQKTSCTNSTKRLNLTVSIPSLKGSAAPPTAMLVRLGLLAKKYHSPVPPPENTWYLNSDIGRWRLDTPGGQSVEFDGAAFVELRLPALATHGGQLTLALSFLGDSTGSPPTIVSDRSSLRRPIRGAPIGNATIPPVRTLMFASVVLESRSCDDTISALKVDDDELKPPVVSSQNGSTHFSKVDDEESPGPLAVLLSVAAPAPIETPAVMTAHSLASTDPGARCINGQPASVFAWINPTPSTGWVITLGSVSPTLSICVTPGNCAFFAQPPSNGSSPPPPPIPLAQGPQSTNCSINPTWCRANQASIEMCSFDLGIGDAQTVFQGTAQPAGKNLSGTVLTFAGRKTIAAAITKLGTLGLKAATSVLLNGIAFDGTAVILNADFIGQQLKSVAPQMAKYKALPVDAIHPRFGTLLQFLLPTEPELKESNWLLPVYSALGNLSGALPALSAGCKAANAKNPYLCLDANESLPFVKTPTFLVQQTPSVWDFQCLFGGWYDPGFILQVECSYKYPSRRIRGYMNVHKCTQVCHCCCCCCCCCLCFCLSMPSLLFCTIISLFVSLTDTTIML
eukprot:SAG22_NODE_594_length_8738_cov_20.249219_4_plen_738_part_00